MSDLRLKWHGHKIRSVPVLIVRSCVGCVFDGETSRMCPRPGEGEREYCYDPEEKTDDFIWIEDTEQAFSEYVTARVTGELPEDDED